MGQSPLKNHNQVLIIQGNTLRFYTLIILFLIIAIQTTVTFVIHPTYYMNTYYTIYLITTGCFIIICTLAHGLVTNLRMMRYIYIFTGLSFYSLSLFYYYEASPITITLMLLSLIVVEIVSLEKFSVIIYISISIIGSCFYLAMNISEFTVENFFACATMILPLLLTLYVSLKGISILEKNQNALTNSLVMMREERQKLVKLNKAFAGAEMEIRQQFEKIYDQAYKDITTKLHNKNYLYEILEMMHTDDSPYALLFISCNDFRLEDNHHQRGISHGVNIHMAESLIKLNDKRFEIGHYQGDVFYAIINNPDEATAFANAFVDLYTNAIAAGSINLVLKIHIGIYDFEKDDTVENAVSYAEIAMYQAKKDLPMGYTTFSKELLKDS